MKTVACYIFPLFAVSLSFAEQPHQMGENINPSPSKKQEQTLSLYQQDRMKDRMRETISSPASKGGFLAPKVKKLPSLPPLRANMKDGGSTQGNSLSAPLGTKAEAMNQCFTSIRDVLRNREHKKLLAKEIPSKNITCSESSWPLNSNIWRTRYPRVSCYDNRRSGQSFGVSDWSDSVSYSETEKAAKLNQCRRFLASLKAGQNPPRPVVANLEPIDLKAQAMSQCLSDIQKALNNRRKSELLAEGVPSESITCFERAAQLRPGSMIWETEYPRGNCGDKRYNEMMGYPMAAGGAVLGLRREPYSEKRKMFYLDRCRRFLANVKAGQNPPYPVVRSGSNRMKAQDMAQCFSDVQSILDKNKRKALRSKGVPFMNIICKWNFNYHSGYIWGAEYPKASCLDSGQALEPAPLRPSFWSEPSELEKANKLIHCRLHLAGLKANPERSYWEQCVESAMRKKQRVIKNSMLQRKPDSRPENISCSGSYGTEKSGWSINCYDSHYKYNHTGSYSYPQWCGDFHGAQVGAGAGRSGTGNR